MDCDGDRAPRPGLDRACILQPERQPAQEAAMPSVRVPGFLPSVNGFTFANAWPPNPIRQFRLGNVATLNIGDAANGLCGGMSFTVADLHVAGIPPDNQPQPAADSDRYRYIVDRQIASFDDGRLPLRFYSLMSPTRPDRESTLAQLLGYVGIDRHSRTWTMIRIEWPRIRQALDGGRLAMIGLVRAVSPDPFKLSLNHQVLAYGYDMEGSTVTLRICDPNWPRDDEVTLAFATADPGGSILPAWSKSDTRPVCFFMAPYEPRDPAAFR
jgi:hypothetical protein